MNLTPGDGAKNSKDVAAAPASRGGPSFHGLQGVGQEFRHPNPSFGRLPPGQTSELLYHSMQKRGGSEFHMMQDLGKVRFLGRFWALGVAGCCAVVIAFA